MRIKKLHDSDVFLLVHVQLNDVCLESATFILQQTTI